MIAFGAVWCLAKGLPWITSIQLHAQTAEKLPYGSRAGMEITITDRMGIGTSGAAIAGTLTRANAADYCKQYVGDISKSCIDKYLAETHLSKGIGANCDTGVFINFYGEKFQVEKKVNAGNGPGSIYRVVDLKDGTELDGSAASGLFYNLEQFYALCPQWKNAKTQAAQTPPLKRDQFPVVLAHAFGPVPGAIVCADYQTAQLLLRLFNRHWADSLQDKLTKGYSELLRGAAAPAPDVEAFGCALLSEGTPMSLEAERPFAIVSFESSGSVFRGITLQGMYVRPMTPSRN